MRLLTLFFCIVLALAAQTNPACPNATGAQPHCVTLTWTAPTIGAPPTSYRIYTGGLASNACGDVHASTCTLLGTVTSTPLATTFTANSSATFQFAEGATYFFVVTAVSSFGESGPSNEASATIPFVFMPTTPTALACTGH